MSGPEPCVAAIASTRSGPCSLEEEPGDRTADRCNCERLRSVPDAVCSEVLPSRNQTVALRAPDSSFLKKWDRLFRRPHSPSKKELSNYAVAISGRWASQARKLSNVAFRPQYRWRGEGPRPSRVILSDELLQDMVEAGLVTLLPAPEPAPAGVANRKDGTSSSASADPRLRPPALPG
jgi:hypothetical protein